MKYVSLLFQIAMAMILLGFVYSVINYNKGLVLVAAGIMVLIIATIGYGWLKRQQKTLTL